MATSTFFGKLEALYWANSESFGAETPMKMYRGFIISKINEPQSSVLRKLAWRIVHIVTGLFSYPILGLGVVFGMAGSLLNWKIGPGKEHNRRQSNRLEMFNRRGHSQVGSAESFPATSSLAVPRLQVFRKYDITFGPEPVKGAFDESKQTIAAELNTVMEQFNNAYTEVYIQYSGSWEQGMAISFMARAPLHPYCANPLLPAGEEIVYSLASLQLQNLQPSIL